MNDLLPDKPLRVGILGNSDIARRKFMPALVQSGKAVLVAVGSMQRERPSGVQAPLMSYRELVCDPDIDLIYISLPNHLHEEWSIRALEQGKHVMCEKPLGLCAASVNRMLETSVRHGRLLYENLMYLQHPQHKIVKSLIADGHIGRLLSLRSEFSFPGPSAGDFRLDPARGGGAFHDLNRYPLSAALYFLEGKTHRFLAGTTEMRDGLSRSLQAESVTDAGEGFSFLISFGRQYRSFYEIRGARGTIRVERAYTTPADMENEIFVTIDGRDQSFRVPPCDHFLGTIEHVCALIRSGSWKREHERARKLAELAGMFRDNCIERIAA
ncbi:MAG: Gfo/Idh/MocA family oxidoreductase [Geobacteraceae bacterium]|nr:Gfo/Idh/MocA family oxidoreductase [Geobacteraceae bacterium]